MNGIHFNRPARCNTLDGQEAMNLTVTGGSLLPYIVSNSVAGFDQTSRMLTAVQVLEFHHKAFCNRFLADASVTCRAMRPVYETSTVTLIGIGAIRLMARRQCWR